MVDLGKAGPIEQAQQELKKALEKNAEKVVVTDLKEAATFKKDFNVFALGDALGARDAFKAWMTYRQAIENGLEPENVLGTLFWQAKSIALASSASSASESGLSPFVFSKAKKYAGNYSHEELNGLVSNLITLYHDGHRGMVDMETGIERLLLNCGKQ